MTLCSDCSSTTSPLLTEWNSAPQHTRSRALFIPVTFQRRISVGDDAPYPATAHSVPSKSEVGHRSLHITSLNAYCNRDSPSSQTLEANGTPRPHKPTTGAAAAVATRAKQRTAASPLRDYGLTDATRNRSAASGRAPPATRRLRELATPTASSEHRLPQPEAAAGWAGGKVWGRHRLPALSVGA